MTLVWRGIGFSLLVLAGLGLAGCTGLSRFGGTPTASGPAETATPVSSSSVQSNTLPPLDGAATGTQTTTSGVAPVVDPTIFDPTADPMLAEDGSITTLGDVGVQPNAAGRDLSGGLTVSKLLGGWTLVSGADQCRLNLTQTTKTDTNRYRASTPGCTVSGFDAVASWQLAGSQVQLFNEAGDLIGALLQSGNRFVGTLVGGINVSMVG